MITFNDVAYLAIGIIIGWCLCVLFVLTILSDRHSGD